MKSLKALVVEDDQFYLRRVCETLSDYDIENIGVGSLHEAVKQPLEEFGVIIVDVMLPNDPEKSGISAEETRGGALSGLCFARIARKKNKDCRIVFLSGGESSALVKEWAATNACSFVPKVDGYNELKMVLRAICPEKVKQHTSVFIVHGHDEVALLELKNFLQNNLKLPEPIVLREKPNGGRAILEKFEDFARDVDVVFVLLTPDDSGKKLDTNEERRRARQNVIFELGFFFGRIGRSTGKVIVLSKGSVELPSDIHGIAWIGIDNGVNAAGEDIRREMKALGLLQS